MITNILKRENTDTKITVTPNKKKKKLPKGKSRKRRAPKTQCDNSEPKVKKSRKTDELQCDSPKVEIIIDRNVDLNLVSKYILVLLDTNNIY